MKKLSNKHKLYLKRRARKLHVRKVLFKQWIRYERIKEIYPDFDPSNNFDYPLLKVKRRKPIFIDVPETLSLSNNYDETLAFIDLFRLNALKRGSPVTINFKTLKRISPAAALFLVAELDRWRTLYNIRPRVVEIEKWDPLVKRLLYQKGFFDILKPVNPPLESSFLEVPNESNVEFIRYLSNAETLGDEAKKLREELEKIVGEVPHSKNLFRALTEAMGNVSTHAYPDKFRPGIPYIKNRWWMSGSFNLSTKMLSVVFMDQGIGIPATLPKTHAAEEIQSILSKLGLIDEDGSRIKAALEMGRTRTKKSYRGKGLSDILKYIENAVEGSLRIISGRGEYVYHNKEKEVIQNHKSSLGGTLIQWDLQV